MKVTARMKLKFTLMALSACSLGSSAPLCAAPPEISIAQERKQVINRHQVITTAMLPSQQELLGLPESGKSQQALVATRASQGPKGLVIRTAGHVLPPIGTCTMDVRPAVKILT